MLDTICFNCGSATSGLSSRQGRNRIGTTELKRRRCDQSFFRLMELLLDMWFVCNSANELFARLIEAMLHHT
jgi:hypothetical protein